MSNTYATTTGFFDFFDARTLGMLSNDANQRQADTARLQRMLDMHASELDTHLANRYTLPMASPPAILGLWVYRKTKISLWGRRTDKPKELDGDEKWCADFIDALDRGSIALPGIDRAIIPTLDSSDAMDGSSRFDGLPGFSPRGTNSSVSKGL